MLAGTSYESLKFWQGNTLSTVTFSLQPALLQKWLFTLDTWHVLNSVNSKMKLHQHIISVQSSSINLQSSQWRAQFKFVQPIWPCNDNHSYFALLNLMHPWKSRAQVYLRLRPKLRSFWEEQEIWQDLSLNDLGKTEKHSAHSLHWITKAKTILAHPIITLLHLDSERRQSITLFICKVWVLLKKSTLTHSHSKERSLCSINVCQKTPILIMSLNFVQHSRIIMSLLYSSVSFS